MKKLILSVLLIVLTTTVQAQIFKEIYKDFVKYGTVYAAGDISNSIEAAEPTYFLRTNQDGSIYSIPDVVDNTPIYPYDFRYGFGIRKLARFGYERKPKTIGNCWHSAVIGSRRDGKGILTTLPFSPNPSNQSIIESPCISHHYTIPI